MQVCIVRFYVIIRLARRSTSELIITGIHYKHLRTVSYILHKNNSLKYTDNNKTNKIMDNQKLTLREKQCVKQSRLNSMFESIFIMLVFDYKHLKATSITHFTSFFLKINYPNNRCSGLVSTPMGSDDRGCTVHSTRVSSLSPTPFEFAESFSNTPSFFTMNKQSNDCCLQATRNELRGGSLISRRHGAKECTWTAISSSATRSQ